MSFGVANTSPPPAFPSTYVGVGKACVYCTRNLFFHKLTRDHVIPKWVLMHFPDFREIAGRNMVYACASCNRGKANMPAAEFIRVRTIPGARKKAEKKWATVTHKLGGRGGFMSTTHPEYLAIRRLVLVAFTEPAPGIPEPLLTPIGAAMRRILSVPEPTQTVVAAE